MMKDRNCARFVYIVVIHFALHWSSCIYYHVFASYRDLKHTSFGEALKRYGFVDFHSMNSRQKIYVISFMLFSLVFKSYIISKTIDLVLDGISRIRKDMGKEDNAESEDMGKEGNAESEDMGKEENAESEDMGKEENAESEELTQHEMELLTYRRVIEVMNESRLPLRFEHKLLLKLQNVLNVSEEEHLAELRNALPQ